MADTIEICRLTIVASASSILHSSSQMANHHLKNNSFTKEERDTFVRALNHLVADDVGAVRVAMNDRKIGCSQHIPILQVILSVPSHQQISEADAMDIMYRLISVMRWHANDYAALLGGEDSDFSRLATVKFCYNYSAATATSWQSISFNINDEVVAVNPSAT
jgi:hypothetical protein